MKINIAGILVDNVTKEKAIAKIDEFVRSGKPNFIVTPYSEFIVFAHKNPEYLKVLNSASLSLPDGIGVLWAATYLKENKSNPFWEFLKLVFSLLRLLFSSAYGREVIKERVVGSHLIWDIAALAAKENYSIALVGGVDSVAAQTAFELKRAHPNLKVNLTVSGNAPFDDKLISEIATSNSDILLIAYSPPKQETWLSHNLPNLNVKVGVGLGGTFDYVAKRRMPAPKFLHNMGLEWFWRLITQPHRIKRMWNAVPVFIWTVYKYKLSKT